RVHPNLFEPIGHLEDVVARGPAPRSTRSRGLALSDGPDEAHAHGFLRLLRGATPRVPRARPRRGADARRPHGTPSQAARRRRAAARLEAAVAAARAEARELATATTQ